MTLDSCVKAFPDENLVGFWPLNETSGTNAPDKSGNGNDGTLHNMEDADWVDGVVGKCLSFDGVDEYVSIPFAQNFTAYTFSFWQDQCANKMALGSSNDTFYKFGENSWYDPIDEWYHGVGSYMTGRYYFVVTWDGTTQKIYVNGVERASRDHSGTCNFNTTLYLGKWSGPGYEYTGIVDEVRIYNKALDLREIKDLYNTPGGPGEYCTATGTKCYNTYATCRDKANFSRTTKELKFTPADCPVPFRTGERPYIEKIAWFPTEIKHDNLTTKARVKITMLDEADTDIGIDPYVSDRSSVQGTFWKKLLARSPNYKGRKIQIYEGFDGLAESDFQEKFVGTIDNIARSGNRITIEAVDILKSLADIDIPPELDVKITTAITDSQTTITLDDVTDLDSAGYVRINDEIIQYTAKNAVSNQLTGCARGKFSTIAAAHSENDKVQKCRYYAQDNPFDILQEMLSTDAGIAAGYIDSASFTTAKGWPGGEIDFEAIISEPTSLEELFFEIVELIDCKVWVAEDLKITISRNIPNEGGRSYTTLTDAENIIDGSGSVDLNEKSRITRVSIYWDPNAIGDREKPATYARLDIAIDSDAESVNEYNDEIKKTIWCRWINSGCDTEENLNTWINELTGRYVLNRRDAAPLVTLSVEMKDSGLKTGDYVMLSTDEIQEIDGNDVSAARFRVIRREEKGNRYIYKLERLPKRRACLINNDGAADYDSATDAEKEYGYITDDYGEVEGEMGYFIY
jgi:hypothetical protein